MWRTLVVARHDIIIHQPHCFIKNPIKHGNRPRGQPQGIAPTFSIDHQHQGFANGKPLH